MQHRVLPWLLVSVWAVAALAGWGWLARYSSTPGSQSSAPARLPAELRFATQMLPQAGTDDILVALHPQCSCSLATMRELARLVAESGAQVRVTLLMYKPAHTPEHWRQTNDLPAQVPGLHPSVLKDIDGHYAALLGASTSGEVLVYSRAGRLLFQGGITPERGHEGTSLGGARLLEVLRHDRPSTGISNVFGCPISDSVRGGQV